jgi:hypothetical protein
MPSMSKLRVTNAKWLVFSVVMVIIGSSTSKAGYIYTTIVDPSEKRYTSAFGINNAGQIVGQRAGDHSGFLYSSGVFTTIDGPSMSNISTALGINNSGQFVGYYSDPTGWYGFVKSGGSYTTLDVPFTQARGINDAGDVAGLYYGTYDVGGISVYGQYGFVKSGEGYRTIHVPGAISTAAYGINNSGQVAGTFVDSTNTYGFIEKDGVFTILDPGTVVYGINNLGDVVGYYSDYSHGHGNFGVSGFVMSGGVYTTIQVPGSYYNAFTQAQGINDLGQIVGFYTPASDPTNVYGFLATPDVAAVPEPSMSVLMSTLLGLGYVWRRRLNTRHGVTASEQDIPV